MKNTLVEALRLQKMPEAFDGKAFLEKYGHALHRWAYVRELMFLGYYRHGKLTGNDIEIRLIKNYIDSLIEEGIDNVIDFDYASTDQISQANALLFLYDEFGEEKYKELAGRFFEAMLKFPRTSQGSFWHKSNYPHQVWLDGLYMAHLFYTGYVKRFCEVKDYSDTLKQLATVRELCYVPEEGVYYHACDTERQMFWCDKETGRSPNVWLRSVGWLSMALVEIYETIRDDEPKGAETLRTQLEELLTGMMPYRRKGMWYQVFNRPDEEKNYLETSGSLMLAFAMMKAARIRMIGAQWLEEGVKVYESVVEQFLTEENSEVFLNNICKSAGLGKNPGTGVVRDGSYEYYTTGELIVPNNGHGVGALFLAENEYLQAKWK